MFNSSARLENLENDLQIFDYRIMQFYKQNSL